MECPSQRADSPELLISYVEGSLDGHTAQLLERHFQTCASCRELVAAQRELWDALDSWKPTDISPDFDERLYRRIHAEERVPKPKPYWNWRPAMSLAAACLALVAFVWLRVPEPAPLAAVPAQNLQIEQVESALEDIELLTQIGLPAPQGTTAWDKL